MTASELEVGRTGGPLRRQHGETALVSSLEQMTQLYQGGKAGQGGIKSHGRVTHRILSISQCYCLGFSQILRIQIEDKR